MAAAKMESISLLMRIASGSFVMTAVMSTCGEQGARAAAGIQWVEPSVHAELVPRININGGKALFAHPVRDWLNMAIPSCGVVCAVTAPDAPTYSSAAERREGHPLKQ